mmetsp:Transcript_103943/g.298727  ORF Transcript_103943/g.298727 Transcript_103943/m.298727 type:complete len:207 (+) Transcript_103943:415-1035(+)
MRTWSAACSAAVARRRSPRDCARGAQPRRARARAAQPPRRLLRPGRRHLGRRRRRGSTVHGRALPLLPRGAQRTGHRPHSRTPHSRSRGGLRHEVRHTTERHRQLLLPLAEGLGRLGGAVLNIGKLLLAGLQLLLHVTRRASELLKDHRSDSRDCGVRRVHDAGIQQGDEHQRCRFASRHHGLQPPSQACGVAGAATGEECLQVLR